MSLWDQVRQAVEGLMNSARISSASPNFVNRVEGYDWFSETGDFEEVIREEVRNIMMEMDAEIKEAESQSGIGTVPAEDSEGTNVEATVNKVAQKGAGAVQNPLGALQGAVRSIPIPHAQLVAMALALVPIIFELITRDGGALDLRFKRKMLNEQNSFLDRQTQKNTQIGLRQVIIQSRAGFIQLNGAGGNGSSIRQHRDGFMDESQAVKIGMTDHAKELFSP